MVVLMKFLQPMGRVEARIGPEKLHDKWPPLITTYGTAEAGLAVRIISRILNVVKCEKLWNAACIYKRKRNYSIIQVVDQDLAFILAVSVCSIWPILSECSHKLCFSSLLRMIKSNWSKYCPQYHTIGRSRTTIVLSHNLKSKVWDETLDDHVSL